MSLVGDSGFWIFTWIQWLRFLHWERTCVYPLAILPSGFRGVAFPLWGHVQVRSWIPRSCVDLAASAKLGNKRLTPAHILLESSSLVWFANAAETNAGLNMPSKLLPVTQTMDACEPEQKYHTCLAFMLHWMASVDIFPSPNWETVEQDQAH